MANRFCASCGARLLTGANFCVECGERQPGAKMPRVGFSIPLQRYAPLFVVLVVAGVGAGTVLFGRMTPQTAPSVPGRGTPSSPAAGGSSLPEGHPPIAIPDQVKQAIRDLAQKAQAAPEDLDTWKHLGEVQYRAGQLDPSYLPEATAAYRHVLEREPDNLDAIRNLGNIAFDQDQHDIAIGYYQDYLKRKPDDLGVQTDMGTMYLSSGKPELAIATYDAVLKTDPSFFQAHVNIGLAYRSLGQNDKALAALEKARTLAPDDKTRMQVEQLLARAKAQPSSGQMAPASTGQPPAAPAVAGNSFQADAEAIFRQNPILGSKVQRIEWPGAESARVHLRDFPMDQMPEAMRTMFVERMKGRIKEKKEAHNVTQTARFEMVDDATGNVMDTITE
jgi:tetratricopeptide (TPR) repeat protein